MGYYDFGKTGKEIEELLDQVPGYFDIKVTIWEDTQNTDGVLFKVASEKTFEEVLKAYESGKILRLRTQYFVEGQNDGEGTIFVEQVSTIYTYADADDGAEHYQIFSFANVSPILLVESDGTVAGATDGVTNGIIYVDQSNVWKIYSGSEGTSIDS